MYQQQPQQGFGRLLLDVSFSPMNWFLFFVKPTVVVNGQARQVEWGRFPIDLPAGQHNVEVHFQYFGTPRGGARATIPVIAHQQQSVFYRAPAYMFVDGAMGPTPQSTPGMTESLVIGALVGLLLVLAILL